MTHPPLDRLETYAYAGADATGRLLLEAHLAFCTTCSATVADYQHMAGSLPAATLGDQLDLPPFGRVWRAVSDTNVAPPSTMATVLPAPLLTALPQPHARRWVTIAWPKRVRVALLIRMQIPGVRCTCATSLRGAYFRITVISGSRRT